MCRQPLAVVENPKFLQWVQADVAVSSNAPLPSLCLIVVKWKDAVAEIPLRARTENNVSVARCQTYPLTLIQVSGVN